MATMKTKSLKTFCDIGQSSWAEWVRKDEIRIGIDSLNKSQEKLRQSTFVILVNMNLKNVRLGQGCTSHRMNVFLLQPWTNRFIFEHESIGGAYWVLQRLQRQSTAIERKPSKYRSSSRSKSSKLCTPLWMGNLNRKWADERRIGGLRRVCRSTFPLFVDYFSNNPKYRVIQFLSLSGSKK